MRSDTQTPPRPAARLFLTLLLLPALLAIGGCIVTGGPNDGPLWRAGLTSTYTPAEIIHKLGERRVLFVGETHTRYDHHLLQLRALEALHRADPRLAIGVEWFQRPAQPHLDDYIAGRIDEKTLLSRSEYYQRWRFDYRLYRPILQYARRHGIPVIALNAPVELTKAIGDKGLDGLTPAQSAQLPPVIDRSNQQYIEQLREVFDHHPKAEERNFEHFVDVQLTWDETMAQQVADYLQRHPQQRMIVFAGIGHVQYGWGIPDRVARQSGLRPVIVLPTDDGKEPEGRADYLVMTREQKLPAPGLLGVFVDQAGGQARILHVIDDGAAAKAGLVRDDLILAIDGQPTASFGDVKFALMGRTPGDRVRVRVGHLDSQESREVELILQ